MAKKRVATLVLSIALLLAVTVGGTLAYLTDTDSDVNVMTLGNVDIEQIEQEWSDGKLVDFTQAKPLYPYVGELGWEYEEGEEAWRRFTMANVQDKYVTVKNTGASDAYVRTFIALEMGDYSYDEFNMIGISTNAAKGAEFQFDGAWVWTDDFVAEIDGHNYNVMVAVHQNPVKPGETTIPSLLQVYLKNTATNETVEKLDGNGNGTYDILVLSQAVQTNGFENATTALNTAFPMGTDYANVAGWFTNSENKVVIPNVLMEYNDIWAVYGADGNYVLGDDIEAADMIFFGVNTDVSLDLNGKVFNAENKNQYAIAAPDGSVLRLTGNGTVNAGKGFFATQAGEIIVDGGTYNMTNTGVLNGMAHHSLAQNNGKIVINGGTFISNVDNAALFFATSNARIEINGGFFENTADETPDLLSIGKNAGNTNRIIITGGTFVNYNPLNDEMTYTGAWPSAGEAAFGGPWILIPGGYEVVSETQDNGDIWYSVVAK